MMINIFRRLPMFKGKKRLAGYLFNKEQRSLTDVEIPGKWGCRYIVPHIKESVSWELYVNGVYEKETIEFLISHIPVNGVFVDAGANIGSISIPIARLRKDVTIIAVEASPWVYDYFVRNIRLNSLPNIHPVHAALSDIDGQVLNFYSPAEKFGKGSFTNNFNTHPVEVRTITLDNLVHEKNIGVVNVIKIDVEGYEARVLRGASSVLQNKPKVLFEFGDWTESSADGVQVGDAQLELLSRGYGIYNFDNGLRQLPEVVTKGAAMLWATMK